MHAEIFCRNAQNKNAKPQKTPQTLWDMNVAIMRERNNKPVAPNWWTALKIQGIPTGFSLYLEACLLDWHSLGKKKKELVLLLLLFNINHT